MTEAMDQERFRFAPADSRKMKPVADRRKNLVLVAKTKKNESVMKTLPSPPSPQEKGFVWLKL